MTLKYIQRFFVSVWYFGFICAVGYGMGSAQDRLRLVSADRLEGTVENGVPVKRLLGHVRLVQGNAFLECEDALWWEDSQRIRLMHQVVIHDGERTLRADEVDYNGKLKVERASGHVVLERGMQRMLADVLIFWQESRLASAKGRVQLEDSKEHLTLIGEEMVFDQAREYGFSEGNPQLIRWDTTSAQNHWYGTGKKMEFWGKQARVVMTDSVWIHQENTEAHAQIAEYWTKDSLLVLRRGPRIFQNNRKMEADSIAIYLEGTRFREAHLIGSAQIVSEKDSIRDELYGKKIRIYARGDTLEKVIVTEQAKSIFTILDESHIPQGRNTVTGDEIEIVFEGDQIKTVAVKSRPGLCVGEYVPWKKDRGFPVMERGGT